MNEVERFLAQLPQADEELLIETATKALSLIEVWSLACVLGYRGSFGDLAAWARPQCEREDRIAVLNAEVTALKTDLSQVRASVAIAGDVEDEVALLGRVSALSKELRGHLAELGRMSERIDRRSLMMSGAECVLKELRAVFGDNQDVQLALNQASMAAWLQASEQK